MNKPKREIPGYKVIKSREFRYVSDDGNNKFEEYLFRKITTLSEKPIAQSGGVISENCKIALPSGELFHGLSYKGDISGWRIEIEQRIAVLGLLTAKIDGENILISDNRQYPLSDCKIEFY